MITIFCFAGRRGNMEIQLPYVKRILFEHPDVEYHVWNLARDHDDGDWLETIEGERIRVIEPERHAGGAWNCPCRLCTSSPCDHFNAVYRHYAQKEFKDHLFVKIDDDVVFVETDGWDLFVDAVDANRGHIVTAKTINNGACTSAFPGVWQAFQELSARTGLRLRDVYKSIEYAEISHGHMLGHWHELLGEPEELIVPDSWLSINMIGYDWKMGRRLSALLGTRSGRGQFASVLPEAPEWATQGVLVGDEGAANILPRLICQGFLAAHLSYGPQDMNPYAESTLRTAYARIGVDYLSRQNERVA
jgi:hypothetical protein